MNPHGFENFFRRRLGMSPRHPLAVVDRWFEIKLSTMRLVCRVFGHSSKIRKKMYADLCSRCDHVLVEYPQVRIPMTSEELFGKKR